MDMAATLVRTLTVEVSEKSETSASEGGVGTKTARLFCNHEVLKAVPCGQPLTVPVLTISATGEEAKRVQYQHMQHLKRTMHSLGESIADESAPCKVTFRLGIRPEDDMFDFGATLASCTDSDGAEAQQILVAFLRSHLFDVWHSLVPDLQAIHGRFYIFDPFLKDNRQVSVNTTWHQDGYHLGKDDDYFGHYYFYEDDSAAAAGCGATDWAEVALPDPADSSMSYLVNSVDDTGQEDEDMALAIDWSGVSDPQRETIGAHNFIALSTLEKELIVLNDTEVYHRVPLAALFRRPTRTIARVEFHGRDCNGEKVHFVRNNVESGLDTKWHPLQNSERVPEALATLCHEYAKAKEGDGANCATDALSEYVNGDMQMKAWLERSLRREFSNIPVKSTDL